MNFDPLFILSTAHTAILGRTRKFFVGEWAQKCAFCFVSDEGMLILGRPMASLAEIFEKLRSNIRNFNAF